MTIKGAYSIAYVLGVEDKRGEIQYDLGDARRIKDVLVRQLEDEGYVLDHGDSVELVYLDKYFNKKVIRTINIREAII